MKALQFGDRIQILSAPITDRLGFAGKYGSVYGVTAPSVTGVQVVGDAGKNVALAVNLDDLAQTMWFDPSLVEFVDHAAGTEIRIGDRRDVRSADGEWAEDERGNNRIEREPNAD